MVGVQSGIYMVLGYMGATTHFAPSAAARSLRKTSALFHATCIILEARISGASVPAGAGICAMTYRKSSGLHDFRKLPSLATQPC